MRRSEGGLVVVAAAREVEDGDGWLRVRWLMVARMVWSW